MTKTIGFARAAFIFHRAIALAAALAGDLLIVRRVTARLRRLFMSWIAFSLPVILRVDDVRAARYAAGFV